MHETAILWRIYSTKKTIKNYTIKLWQSHTHQDCIQTTDDFQTKAALAFAHRYSCWSSGLDQPFRCVFMHCCYIIRRHMHRRHIGRRFRWLGVFVLFGHCVTFSRRRYPQQQHIKMVKSFRSHSAHRGALISDSMPKVKRPCTRCQCQTVCLFTPQLMLVRNYTAWRRR